MFLFIVSYCLAGSFEGLETVSAQLLWPYKHARDHSDSDAKCLDDIIEISARSYLLIFVLQM